MSLTSMDALEAVVAARRRAHSPLPRHRQVVLRFSDDERALVRAAARADGLAVGAWLGDLAIRAASPGIGVPTWELAMSRSEVLGELVRVRLDVSLALRLLIESSSEHVGAAAVVRLTRAACARLDSLIDRTVDDDRSGDFGG
jgi:hypothetical protein